ncbi:MAG: leucine-rich repeat domain-containing protein, partial [Paludibacteraceae bacterium]|nr:leucine-rich repeat domain-containing protein [Paludibacteraceae bacterium]
MSGSKLVKEVFPSKNEEINMLVSLFSIAVIQGNLSKVSFHLLKLKRPEEQEEELSTKVTKEDRAEAWVDEYGAKYSKDRKRLLKVPRNIEEYAILPGTRVVCDWAFCDCDSLSSVVIPDSVTSIGNWAFYMCISLRSIMLPKSLKEIVGNPLAGLKITITNKSPCFNVYEGNLYDSGRKRLIAFCSGVSDFVIPDSVTAIGNRAFSGCHFLSSVVIPDSVTTIGNSAFSGCRFLSSVVIPDSVTTIGKCAFGYCKSLSSVVIPDSVTTIGNCAFCGCSSLSSVVIPDSVTAIGEYAFEGCSSLSSVVIPDSVTTIGDRAFRGCKSLSSVVIPDSVATIGKDAFLGCSLLNSIIVSRSAYERVCGMLDERPRSKVIIKEDLDSDDDLSF